jgi:hypothetical protein
MKALLDRVLVAHLLRASCVACCVLVARRFTTIWTFRRAFMDERTSKILSRVSEQRARSSLEPWRELIEELRLRRRTYREIAEILQEHCQVCVAPSTIFRFVRARSKAARKARSKTSQLTVPPQMTERAVPSFPEPIRNDSKLEEVQQRIFALKSKPSTREQKLQVFYYNPDEPLRLPEKLEADKTKQ